MIAEWTDRAPRDQVGDRAPDRHGRSARPIESREAFGWFALLVLIFASGYYATAGVTANAPVRALTTVLDDWIAFHPGWLLVYFAVYPAATLPLFVVRDADLFHRIARAYLGVIVLSLACFVLLPVSGDPLRASIASLDPGHWLDWGLLLLHRIDPPRNLMPSLHIALATLAVCGAGRACPRVGVWGAMGLVVVLCAVVGIRQHYALDALAGLLLGLVSAGIALRTWRPDATVAPAHPAQRAIGCLALYVLGLSAFGLAFAFGT